MMHKWWIEHDNGTPGAHGCSDGYIMTEAEIQEEITQMQGKGITVYNYGHLD